MPTWQVRLRLGTVLLALGRQGDATIQLPAANEIAPPAARIETQLALAEAFLDAENLPAAVTALEGALGDQPDGWVLAAGIANATGSAAETAALLREAERRGRNRLLSPYRNLRWERLEAKGQSEVRSS